MHPSTRQNETSPQPVSQNRQVGRQPVQAVKISHPKTPPPADRGQLVSKRGQLDAQRVAHATKDGPPAWQKSSRAETTSGVSTTQPPYGRVGRSRPDLSPRPG